MIKPGSRWFTALVASALLTGFTADASAGHHRRHGSSGSGGSSGSSGAYGSGGSWGSSGSGGSWGSHGSRGYVYGGGSSGGWGSSGSAGAWGGSSGYSGGSVIRVPEGQVVPAPPATDSPPAPMSTLPRSAATVVVHVPEDASVYFSGRKMLTQGTTRKYLVPVPKAGAVFEYPIRVEVVRNGSKLVTESLQRVQAGKTLELTMTESSTEPAISVVQR